jgi:MoCo/4Fe-4S cofactor protein with predicted Tat translocation signal
MESPQMKSEALDLTALRERLAGLEGPKYWKSLEELAETEEFQELLHREFPRQGGEWLDPVSRRGFLKLMAASLALAGLSSCLRPPTEKILPYVQPPEEVIPGVPLFYATAFTLRGFAQGLLVQSHMGRPTKVEGNPRHPLNGRSPGAADAQGFAATGSTDAFAQASVLDLYDPDRSQVVTHLGRISTWDTFLTEMGPIFEAHRVKKGAGLRFVSGAVTSPTLAAQMQRALVALPEARWIAYEPAGRDAVRAGLRLAFGGEYDALYHFDQADVILTLDGDFLSTEPGSLRYARDFIARRRLRKDGPKTMSRLYVVESMLSLAGSMADHRLPLRSADVEPFARALARTLVGRGLSLQGWETASSDNTASMEKHQRWIGALAADLAANAGKSLVLAGPEQPPEVHALAHAMNQALGNAGKTVTYVRPVEASPPDGLDALRTLAEEMDAGKVSWLVVIGSNPAYDAPADLKFAERMAKVPLRVRLGLYEDETSELCHWHVAAAHELETWSDARSWDGTVTILQPLIAPLYGGKSAHELASLFEGKPGRSGYDIVRETWKGQRSDEEFEKLWRRALHEGLVPDTALPAEAPALIGPRPAERPMTPAGPGLEVVFRPDPSVWDGRFANNGWLQELPRPLTKMTWDNAALLAPATAERLGLRNEEVVELRLQGRSVRAPVWILPGHAPDSVTVHLGYGRRRTGRVGKGAGFDAGLIRSSEAPWIGLGLEIAKTGETYLLACTQNHHSMEGRDIVRSAPLPKALEQLSGHAEAGGGEGHGGAEEVLSFYPDWEYKGHAWGMSVDLSACIGCNACVAACVAENNIAVVGKDQVHRSREMHWIRIDRYWTGSLDEPETLYQPMLCQQCEKAPCEVVCPVAATTHSDEGLNDMVYNRCVGTRYCSNNCPYKVRRFNFLQYSDWETESLKLLRNPNVTVRSRGVMEKCTYCVQRINAARIEARKQDRNIRDGEIVTACQQACPTDAIVFGDINDPQSQVARLKAEPFNYGVLAELGTKPRTTYLTRVTNPNPELGTGGAG